MVKKPAWSWRRQPLTSDYGFLGFLYERFLERKNWTNEGRTVTERFLFENTTAWKVRNNHIGKPVPGLKHRKKSDLEMRTKYTDPSSFHICTQLCTCLDFRLVLI